MSDMQAFRKWLSSPSGKGNHYQRRMVDLTQVDREQIVGAVAGMTWFIWGDDQN